MPSKQARSMLYELDELVSKFYMPYGGSYYYHKRNPHEVQIMANRRQEWIEWFDSDEYRKYMAEHPDERCDIGYSPDYSRNKKEREGEATCDRRVQETKPSRWSLKDTVLLLLLCFSAAFMTLWAATAFLISGGTQ